MDFLNIVTKYRVEDKDFKRQLIHYMFAEHFLPEEIIDLLVSQLEV
jgi:hypothetical protein